MSNSSVEVCSNVLFFLFCIFCNYPAHPLVWCPVGAYKDTDTCINQSLLRVKDKQEMVGRV